VETWLTTQKFKDMRRDSSDVVSRLAACRWQLERDKRQKFESLDDATCSSLVACVGEEKEMLHVVTGRDAQRRALTMSFPSGFSSESMRGKRRWWGESSFFHQSLELAMDAGSSPDQYQHRLPADLSTFQSSSLPTGRMRNRNLDFSRLSQHRSLQFDLKCSLKSFAAQTLSLTRFSISLTVCFWFLQTDQQRENSARWIFWFLLVRRASSPSRTEHKKCEKKGWKIDKNKKSSKNIFPCSLSSIVAQYFLPSNKRKEKYSHWSAVHKWIMNNKK
jgi:hypothetical protein